jgi:hypothetical protein
MLFVLLPLSVTAAGGPPCQIVRATKHRTAARPDWSRGPKTWSNTNLLLRSGLADEYDGVKTGWIPNAHGQKEWGCLVTRVKRRGGGSGGDSPREEASPARRVPPYACAELRRLSPGTGTGGVAASVRAARPPPEKIMVVVLGCVSQGARFSDTMALVGWAWRALDGPRAAAQRLNVVVPRRIASAASSRAAARSPGGLGRERRARPPEERAIRAERVAELLLGGVSALNSRASRVRPHDRSGGVALGALERWGLPLYGGDGGSPGEAGAGGGWAARAPVAPFPTGLSSGRRFSGRLEAFIARGDAGVGQRALDGATAERWVSMGLASGESWGACAEAAWLEAGADSARVLRDVIRQ